MTAIYLFRGEEVLLLFRQGGRVVNQVWTGSAGGHFEEFELNDATACVLRELKEELEIDGDGIENLALRYITLRSTGGEIRQNYYFFATLTDKTIGTPISNEGECRWFSLEDIHRLEMPFTAKYVIEHYVKEGRYTRELYVGVTTSTEVHFSPLPRT